MNDDNFKLDTFVNTQDTLENSSDDDTGSDKDQEEIMTCLNEIIDQRKTSIEAAIKLDGKIDTKNRLACMRASVFLKKLATEDGRKKITDDISNQLNDLFDGLVPLHVIQTRVDNTYKHFKDEIDRRQAKKLNTDPNETNPFILPEILSKQDALKQRSDILNLSLSSLYKMNNNFDTILLRDSITPYPHQIRKIDLLLKGAMKVPDIDGIDIATDICPTRGGKTFMEMTLARLAQSDNLSTPVLFLTYSNPILTGEKGALNEALRFFPRGDIGIVNKDFKQHGRLITMVNFAMPKVSENFLTEFVKTCNGRLPIIIIDEGDYFQSERSNHVLNELKHAFKHPIIFALSATEEVNNRNLGDRSLITDKMTVVEITRLKLIKQVLGFYVDVGLDLTADKLSNTQYGRELRFDTLNILERDALIHRPVSLYKEKLMGEKSIFICNQVVHAQAIARELRKIGINAECISKDRNLDKTLVYEKSTEYDDLISRYISGDLTVITGCNVLGRGITLGGGTKNVIMCGVTESLTRLYHAIARGLDLDKIIDILRIFQFLPNIQVKGYKPALIEDIFTDGIVPTDLLHNSIGSITEAEEILRKTNQKNPDYVAMTGVQLPNYEEKNGIFISFLTRQEIRETVNTEDLSNKQKILIKYFNPVIDSILDDDLSIDNIGYAKPGLSTPVNFKSDDGKASLDVKFAWIVRHVLIIIAGVHPIVADNNRSIAFQVIKMWYKNGRPTKEKVMKMIKEKNEDTANGKIIAANFDDLITQFESNAVSDLPLSTKNPSSDSKANTIHEGENYTFSWSMFNRGYLSFLTGKNSSELELYPGLALQMVLQRKNTGQNPVEIANKAFEKENQKFRFLSSEERFELITNNIKAIVKQFEKEGGKSNFKTTNNGYKITFILKDKNIIISKGELCYECVEMYAPGYRTKVHNNFPSVANLVTELLADGKKVNKNIIDRLIQNEKNKREALKLVRLNLKDYFDAFYTSFLKAAKADNIKLDSKKSRALQASISVKLPDNRHATVGTSWHTFSRQYCSQYLKLPSSLNDVMPIGEILKLWKRKKEPPTAEILEEHIRQEGRKKLFLKTIGLSGIIMDNFRAVNSALLRAQMKPGNFEARFTYSGIKFTATETEIKLAILQIFFNLLSLRGRSNQPWDRISDDILELWREKKIQPLRSELIGILGKYNFTQGKTLLKKELIALEESANTNNDNHTQETTTQKGSIIKPLSKKQKKNVRKKKAVTQVSEK